MDAECPRTTERYDVDDVYVLKEVDHVCHIHLCGPLIVVLFCIYQLLLPYYCVADYCMQFCG